MRWRIRFPGLRTLVVLVALAALAAVFLRLPYTDKIRSLGGGALAAVSAGLYQAGVWGQGAWQRATAQNPDLARQEADRQGYQDMRNRVVFLSMRLKELSDEISDLTRIRTNLQQSEGQLVPAYVAAGDASGYRDVLQVRPVSADLERLVHPGDWVLTPLLPPDATEGRKAQGGFTRLAGSILVGSVSEVGPLTTRVKLLSDPASGLRVSILRIQDTQLIPVEKNVILEGRGNGQMQISDLKRETGVRVGDVVVSEAAKSGVWGGLVIGQVTSIEEHPKPRLLVRANVGAPVPFNQLLRVYILSRETAK